MTVRRAGVTHVFLEVNDLLIDGARLQAYYECQLGCVMAARFGGNAAVWSTAYRRVLADWDSYYADLNLSGDDGLADMQEGMFRTTRALFRLACAPEPEKAALTALARELPALASRGHDALCPEAAKTLQALSGAGIVLGVISHRTAAQLQALLEPVLPHFRGTIWGADNAERFDKDVPRYLAAASRAQAVPGNCLVADPNRRALVQARAAGMQTLPVGHGRMLLALLDACLSREGVEPYYG